MYWLIRNILFEAFYLVELISCCLQKINIECFYSRICAVNYSFAFRNRDSCHFNTEVTTSRLSYLLWIYNADKERLALFYLFGCLFSGNRLGVNIANLFIFA